MVKVFIAYDSKFGNTKLVAEKIAEGILETPGIEVYKGYVKEIDIQKLADYDAIVIGAPNHNGGPSWTAKRFIDKLGKVKLNAKWIAAFDTYFKREKYYRKALKKMEKKISEKITSPKLITPGLSIKVVDVSGPVADGELPKSVEFGKQIAAEITG